MGEYRSAETPAIRAAIVMAECARIRELRGPVVDPPGGVERITCAACNGSMVSGDEWCPACRGWGKLRRASLCPCEGSGLLRDSAGIVRSCPDCQSATPMERLRSSSVPGPVMGFTMETYLAAQTGVQNDLAVVLVKMLAEMGLGDWREKTGRNGLFLYGKAGVGKTGLASIAMRHIFRRTSGPSAWATWSYYLDSRRPDSTDDYGRRVPRSNPVESQPSESELISAFVCTLDDVGGEQDSGTQWRSDQLYQILDARTLDGGFTIITSNLDLDRFSGVFGQRAASRVEGLCMPVEVHGQDLRKSGRVS